MRDVVSASASLDGAPAGGEHADSGVFSQAHLAPVAGLILLAIGNKGIGFAREAVVAAQFGADYRMDGVLAGQTVPFVLSRVIEDVLVASVLPLYARWAVAAGDAVAWAKLARVLTFLAAIGLGAVGLIVLLAPVLIEWLTPGLGPAASSIAVTSLQISAPSVEFLVLGSAFTAVLNYQRRFAWAAASGVIGNVVALLVLVLLSQSLQVLSLPVAVNVSAALLVACQAPFLLRRSRRDVSESVVTSEVVAEFCRLAGPLMLGVMFFNGIPLIERFLASGLAEGSIALMNYAFKVDWLAYSIVVTSLSTVVFQQLAIAGAHHDDRALGETLVQGIRYCLLLVLLCGAVLTPLAAPVCMLIYQRGNFGAADTLATARILQVYLIGLPGASLSLVLLQAVYALKLPRLRVAAGLVLLPTAAVSGWLLRARFGAAGIALAHVCSLTTLAIYLGYALRHWIVRRRALGNFLVRLAIAAAAAAAAGEALSLATRWSPASGVAATAGLVVVEVCVSATTFVLVARCLRLHEINLLTDPIVQILGRVRG